MKFYQLPVILTVLLLQACANQSTQDTSGDTNYIPEQQANIHYPHSQSAKSESNKQNYQTKKDKTRQQSASNDLWVVLQDNLEIKRNLDNQAVREKLEFYASKQEFLDRVADRATPYLYHIISELEKRDMPMDLALLPIVESAYQPFAQSPSRAVGIWQFIPSTGKYFGLKQTWWYDGRRDIVAATDAALTYLQKLHDEFDGDWLLALAAYNAGELTINRAIEKNRKLGKPTDFWALNLRAETMGYVPSFLAVAEIVAAPDKYQISLKSIPNNPYFAIIDTGSQIDLATASKLSGLSTEQVHLLNPGINRWATDPDGPHTLLIPIDKADSFREKLAALPVSERIKWQVYTIKKGDTLGRIAALYGTDVNSLKRANNLNSTLIHPGNTLRIPAGKNAGDPGTIAKQVISNERNTVAKNVATSDTVSYQVKSGDSLWSISRQFEISVDDLCKLNGITTKTILKPGNKLAIKSLPDTELPVIAKNTKTTGNTHIVHTVKRGDSLWLIAKQYGVTVYQIQQWNSLKKNSALMPGQSLDIYTETSPTDV